MPNYEIIAQKRPELLIMGTALSNLEPVIEKLTPLGVSVAALDLQPMKGSSARERENYYNQELMLLGRITGKGKKAP